MTLADARLKELDNPSLTPDGRALLRCEVAADLMDTGRYADAREALGELWRGIGEQPNLKGLREQTAAEVLLQAGALSGWIGASEQVQGAQSAAKDLMSESVARFERLGDAGRAAVARSNLAICYWREGAYDEARVLLEDAYTRSEGGERKMQVALRFAVVESSAGHYHDALRLLTESAPFLETSANHALKGNFHNELAIALQLVGTAERRENYFDRAIIEYTAAIYHYEQAGNERYGAAIENNLAFLLYKLGRYEQAHEHLDRAGVTFVKLNEAGLLAQVDETRARVFIAEGKYAEASRVLAGVIQTLERGGASALLADAYTVQGVTWARLGAFQSSLSILRRAASLAEDSGGTL